MASNGLWESQRGIYHGAFQHEEAGNDITPARIITVQCSDKGGVVAGRVVLIMNAALWENRPLVEPQLSVDDAVETILHDKAGLELALHDDQELVSAGMQVRYVETTRLKEGDRTRDANSLEDREVGDSAEEDRTALCTCRRFLVIEIEDCEIAKGLTSEEVPIFG